MQNLKINSLFSINKKVCVVSGSSGGLGNTVCKCLLRNGAVVIGLDIKKTKINNKKFFFL